MDRIDRILAHPLFLEGLEKNGKAEANRPFCYHNVSHFLDVARIGVILSFEEGTEIDRELIYGAALLHDIGKHRQYEQGTAHERASAAVAPEILEDCGFNETETNVIVDAILMHRDPRTASEPGLKGILYRADKMSRPCFACEAKKTCDWKEGKKNLKIRY